MKTTYYLIKTILLICLLGMYACTDTEQTNTDQQRKYTVALNLNVPGVVTKVFAGDEAVNRLDILLFRNNKLETVRRNITSFGQTPDGYATVNVFSDQEGACKAYLIANIDDEAWLNSLQPGTTSIDDIASYRTAKLTKMANPPLVMYGISDDIYFSNTQTTVSCNLYRSAARIDVVNQAKNFTLLSARLLRSSESTTLFPGNTITGNTLKNFEQVSTSDSKVTLYSYENRPASQEESTAIEIAGTVNGIPLTYTVEMAEAGAPLSIERNVLYTVNINNVQTNKANVLITTAPWLLGSGIDHIIHANTPTVAVTLDATTGSYVTEISTLNATENGGQVLFDVQANAECELDIADSWVTLSPATRATAIETRYTVLIATNTETTARSTTITFRSKVDKNAAKTITINQAAGKIQKDKYMVVLVAGQSNAVGYDESPVYPETMHKPNPIAYQMSYRYGETNPSIIPLTWCAENIQDMTTIGKTNANGYKGYKGIQLPLANELAKRIPAGYKLLIISVAYGGTSLLTAPNQSTAYDATLMQPVVMNAALQWGIGRPYNRTMADRVKKALSMNPDNKFIGVVWCQGENDATRAEEQYGIFDAMTTDFFGNLNRNGYGTQCAKGVADKDMWYNYSSTSYWSDWYLATNASPVFGGYKVWNPDTFIHVPFNTSTNMTNGNGSTSSQPASHFGNDAYSRVIAPMVAECIDRNGGLFNGNSPQKNNFMEDEIRSQASTYGGSLTDSDLTQGMLAFYPFSESISQNKSLVAERYALSGTSSLVNATGLTDINRAPRQAKALNITATTSIRLRSSATFANGWSLSFLFKRTESAELSGQVLISGSATSPFVGFKKYAGYNTGVAGKAEFVVEPTIGTDRLKAIPGQFMDADNVRDIDGWIHYVITYEATSKTTSIYMNGQLVSQKSIAPTAAQDMATLYLGKGLVYTTGAVGQCANLGIWNKVLTENSVKKLYLLSYYGYTK